MHTNKSSRNYYTELRHKNMASRHVVKFFVNPVQLLNTQYRDSVAIYTRTYH